MSNFLEKIATRRNGSQLSPGEDLAKKTESTENIYGSALLELQRNRCDTEPLYSRGIEQKLTFIAKTRLGRRDADRQYHEA
ncbi:hypothetical protein DVH05_018801 [Phytophthora capsici]|nr:hypothetical protein DVH05_018801 [Phytophthora capsici]